jgi:hypothetical protein
MVHFDFLCIQMAVPFFYKEPVKVGSIALFIGATISEHNSSSLDILNFALLNCSSAFR